MKRLFTTTAIALLMTGAPALAQTGQDKPESSGSQTQMQQNQQDTQGQSEQGYGQQSGQSDRQSGQSDMQSGETAQQKNQDQQKTQERAQTGSDDKAKQDKAQAGDADKLGSVKRASNLMGTSVTNASGETIGEINDILFGQDGEADKALIGVGGFLGIGQKNVAVELSELDFSRDDNNNIQVTTSMTAESLENMPAYAEESGTGMGGGQDSQGTGGTGMQQDESSGQTGGQSGQSGSQL